MTNKHTQGPCTFDEIPHMGFFKIEDKEGNIIEKALHEEDARLYAAAPELLEALELCISKDMLSGEALDKAKEAIAKAKGQ